MHIRQCWLLYLNCESGFSSSNAVSTWFFGSQTCQVGKAGVFLPCTCRPRSFFGIKSSKSTCINLSIAPRDITERKQGSLANLLSWILMKVSPTIHTINVHRKTYNQWKLVLSTNWKQPTNKTKQQQNHPLVLQLDQPLSTDQVEEHQSTAAILPIYYPAAHTD